LIKIKTLLFKLLDEIEPNDLLELKFRSYHSIFVANKKSILPLALEMRYDNIEERSLEQVYRDAFIEDRISEYENEFIMDHIVLLNEKKYIITEELIDIEYFDDYFAVTIASPNETSTNYYKYSDIVTIKVKHSNSNSIVKEYNSLNYKFRSNKNN
jgi:hypothetical protein